MKNIVVLFSLLIPTGAFAAGGAPSRIDCDRDTYRHFLEQGNYVLSIQDENDFHRHWEGFVNRANTEWRDCLLACGYDPQDLRDNLTTVRNRMIFEACAECRKDASDSRERDYDRCNKNNNLSSEKASHRECLDRADGNFRAHLNSCSVKEGSAAIGRFGDRAAVNINIGGGGGGGGGKCEGPSCSK